MLPKNSKRIITSVEFVNNPVLKKKFDNKKVEFMAKNVPTGEIFAYHGTRPENIKSICKSNLNIIHRTAHGNGYYFTEYPEYGLLYGQGLLCFKLLLGHVYAGNSHKNHVGPKAKFNRYQDFLAI